MSGGGAAGFELDRAGTDLGTPYEELGLSNPKLDYEAILDAIEQHPILIERPILVTDKGVRLCRPIEKMNEIMPG